MSLKKLIFAANWKLNKSPGETRSFFAELKKLTEGGLEIVSANKKPKVVFFPPASNWEAASLCLSEMRNRHDFMDVLSWGAQNVYPELSGAFTGENSMQVMQELGGEYCLVGHSERRSYFKETDEFLNKKILKLQEQKLTPLYCIGETLQERELGQTEKVLELQLNRGLRNVTNQNLIIAYEPVWAIGTGKVATIDQVKEAHSFLNSTLATMGFPTTPILYGGSVKAENANQLIHLENVNGFLVGGASLEVKSFVQIIQNGCR